MLAASAIVERVRDGDRPDPLRAMILGQTRSIPLEHPALACVHLDLEGVDTAADGAAIAAELLASGGARDVAVRGGVRLVPGLAAADLGATGAPVMVDGGCYIITGGLGGAGRVLARHLLVRHRARVLLVGRAQADAAALAGLPGDVAYARCDVADGFAWRELLAATVRGWGARIDAVFHLAGTYAEQSLDDADRAATQDVIAAKALGALAIAESLEAYPGAAFVGFSSEMAVTGGPRAGAYAGANQLLDSLVEAMVARGRRAWAIDWTVLADTGLSAGARTAVMRGLGQMAVAPAQMLASLAVMLAARPGRYVVTDPDGPLARASGPLRPPAIRLFYEAARGDPFLPGSTVADASGTPVRIVPHRVAELPRAADGTVDRDALQRMSQGRADRALAADGVEARVAAVWQRVLGVGDVASGDSLFALGAGSLRAMELASALTDTFGGAWTLRDVFEHSTIAEQAARIGAPAQAAAPEQAVDAADERLPLTPAQARMWFLHRLDPASPVYAIEAAIEFTGAFDGAALDRALDLVTARHAALRAIFPADGGAPVQRLRAIAPVRLVPVDVTEDAVDAAARAFAVRPFDLDHGPLVRFELLRPSPKRHVLLINLHHIIGDGASVRILFEDVLAAYAAFQAGRGAPAPRTGMAYPAFLTREAGRDEARDQTGLAFWTGQLDGVRSGTELSADRPRRGAHGFAGGRVTRELDAAAAGAVRRLAAGTHATVFLVMLAAYVALLGRFARQRDVVIGTVSANRGEAALQGLVGCLLNVIVLRVELDTAEPFTALVARVRETLLGALDHADLPFETLVERLLPERDPTRAPFFQIAFDMQDARITQTDAAGVSLRVNELELGTSRYDLHLTIKERGERIVCAWDYATDLFDRATIEALADAYDALLGAAADAPGGAVAALPVASAADRARVLGPFNATARADYALEQTVLDRIAARAAGAPNAVAVRYAGAELRYGDLLARADAVDGGAVGTRGRTGGCGGGSVAARP